MPMKKQTQWWNMYAVCLEPLEYPVLLTDEKAKLLWANMAARQLGLESAIVKLTQSSFFLRNNSTFFDELLQNSQVILPAGELLEEYDYCFTPLFKAAVLQGSIVTLRQHAREQGKIWKNGAQWRAATVAHQMRNPLSAVFAALSGIVHANNTEYEDPALKAYAETISINCYRMLRTSIHFSQFYSYQYGTAQFRPQLQDIGNLLEQLCRVISVMIERAGLKFSYSMPEGPLPVLFDKEIFSLVLLELISNAAKYNEPGGEISVTMEMGEDNVVICVEDNGLGIADNMVTRVFEPYFSHDPRTCTICGDGMGLYLCREGVLQHGGGVALHSKEGEGTRVVFSLPRGNGEDRLASVRDTAANFMFDRFSDLYVILSDVCKVPEQ